MEKWHIDRRMEQMTAEGVKFVTNAHVGVNISGGGTAARSSMRFFSPAARKQPRDLTVPGRELKGIHFAMEFLPQQNKAVAGDHVDVADSRDRQARRHHRRRRHRRGLPRHLASPEGAIRASVRDHAHAARERAASTPWPLWPLQLRLESSHEEGGMREWSIATRSSSRATRTAT